MKKIINKFLDMFKCKHNDKMPIQVNYNGDVATEVTWLCVDCSKEWIEKSK